MIGPLIGQNPVMELRVFNIPITHIINLVFVCVLCVEEGRHLIDVIPVPFFTNSTSRKAHANNSISDIRKVQVPICINVSFSLS